MPWRHCIRSWQYQYRCRGIRQDHGTSPRQYRHRGYPHDHTNPERPRGRYPPSSAYPDAVGMPLSLGCRRGLPSMARICFEDDHSIHACGAIHHSAWIQVSGSWPWNSRQGQSHEFVAAWSHYIATHIELLLPSADAIGYDRTHSARSISPFCFRFTQSVSESAAKVAQDESGHAQVCHEAMAMIVLQGCLLSNNDCMPLLFTAYIAIYQIDTDTWQVPGAERT